MAIRRCAGCDETSERSVTHNPKLRPTWVRLVREPDPAQSEPVHIRGPQDVHRFLHERASMITSSLATAATCRSRKRDFSNPGGHMRHPTKEGT